MALRILQISDCHLFSDPEKVGYADINPARSLASVLEDAKQESPDLVLFTGDISGDDSEASYHQLESMLKAADLRDKVRMIPGNHDVPELMLKLFGESVCRFDSHEDFGQWRLHYLNSHYKGSKGSVSSERLQALEKSVFSSPSQNHIIAVHHHPLDVIHWMDKHDWIDRDRFLQVMYFLPRPVRVLYGHVHNDIHRVFAGHEYYACPSSCWQWAQTEQFGVSDLPPGYRMIELGENGEWLTWVNRVEL